MDQKLARHQFRKGRDFTNFHGFFILFSLSGLKTASESVALVKSGKVYKISFQIVLITAIKNSFMVKNESKTVKL